MCVHHELGTHTPSVTCLSRRTEASSNHTEPIMSVRFSSSASLAAALPGPVPFTNGEESLLPFRSETESIFCSKSRNSKLQHPDHRNFNMKSSGLGLCLSHRFQLWKSSSTSCLGGERKISGTAEALLFGMDMKIKCRASEGWPFLTVLSSFSSFIPLLPVFLAAALPASWGMGYRALPTWRSEKGEEQHTNLAGLLLGFVCPQQNS